VIVAEKLASCWPIRPLGEVATFLDHLRRPVREEDRNPGAYPYYGATSQQGTIDGYIFNEPLVLLAEDGGPFGDSAKPIAYAINGKTWVNNHAHVLRAHAGAIQTGFLFRVLSFYNVLPFITGTTRGKLTKSDASRIPIPLPPLSEQRRVVELLDQADALRRKRAEADAKAARILPALFYQMFGDPATNPMGWEMVDLGAVTAEGPQNGLYKPASEYGDGTPILRIDSFYDGQVTRLESLRRLRLTQAEISRYQLRENDIVINRVNSLEFLGKSALIPQLSEPTVFESNMMRLSVDRTRMMPRFLIEFLQTSFARSQMLGRAKDAINQSSINQHDVQGIQIPLPMVDLQGQFGNRVEGIRQLFCKAGHSHNALDVLFQTLLHRAFSGDLTARWREAHLHELLAEMEQQAQARALGAGTSGREQLPFRSG
jgi:type I restriction enzyme S subunit